MEHFKRVVVEMADIFAKQRVTRSAAAMSYFITISIFPALICIWAVMSTLHMTDERLLWLSKELIPKDVENVITGYLRYVGQNQSALMILIGVFVTFTSSATAFGTLMKIMADIQGRARFSGFWGFLFNFVVSLGFLLVIIVSGLVIVSGEWLLVHLERSIGTSAFLDIWQWLRFALLFGLLLTMIYLVYRVTAPKETKRKHRLPGAALAAVLLVCVSIVFSRMIGLAVNYPVVYGSLASFIILMLWIYICSIIIILGNVFNIVAFRPEPTA
ncbi:YihY/virulence factor BrkB family protein [Oscillospiraceae bacterium CM]|nr:YihY/virulence factor BrkB family protein [Oscillospiraceae bacterium CM]